MAKKPSRRYVVVLVLCVVAIIGIAALGFLDIRPVGHDANVAVDVGVLTN